MENAVSTNNFAEYKRLVDANVNVLNGIVHDFWNETFNGGSRTEILFWINYPNRRLSIHDVGVIEAEDLFQMGMVKGDLDMDGYEDVVEMLEEERDGIITAADKSKVQDRINLILSRV